MKIKKQRSGIVLLFLILALFGCSPSQPELTIKTVKELAQKGDALTMSDFAPYESQDVGFGLDIRTDSIDEFLTQNPN